MTQLVTRLDDRLVREVDALIADAYRRRPQTEAELAGLDAATRALVEAEP